MKITIKNEEGDDLNTRNILTQSGSFKPPPKQLTGHILVIDDEIIYRKSIQKWLMNENHKVTVCENGSKGWDLLNDQKNNFDIVITDVKMPGLSGFSLLEMMQEKENTKKIPVLLMSAQDKTDNSTKNALNKGASDYIFKPIIPSILVRRVQDLLVKKNNVKREKQFKKLIKSQQKSIQNLTEMLQSKNTENIDTPIETITNNIREAVINEEVPEKVKQDLNMVLKLLSIGNLFTPQLENSDIDPLAQSIVVDYSQTNVVSGGGRRGSVAISHFPTLVHSDVIEELSKWEFNCWKYERDEDLLPLIKTMFVNFNLLEEYKIPEIKLEKFILEIKKLYKKNPYHNFRHAFDVTQTVYCFLTEMEAANYLTKLDILVLLVSALCHDVEHPGFNNKHMVVMDTEIAFKFNDQSVLENHHCLTSFTLLKNPQFNFLENLSKDDFASFRKSMISIILSTDMNFHFAGIAKVKSRLSNIDTKPLDREDANDRLLLLEVILHSADISNVAKPWDVSLPWSVAVTEEMFNQGDVERKAGLVPDMFTDRNKTTMAQNTSGFVRFVCRKHFECLPLLFPISQKLLTYIDENLDHWQKKIQEEKDNSENKN